MPFSPNLKVLFLCEGKETKTPELYVFILCCVENKITFGSGLIQALPLTTQVALERSFNKAKTWGPLSILNCVLVGYVALFHVGLFHS